MKMKEDPPTWFKHRLYLINNVADDDDGAHSLKIHSAHLDTMVEKGVLVMMLAFAFCKGSSQVRSGIIKGGRKEDTVDYRASSL